MAKATAIAAMAVVAVLAVATSLPAAVVADANFISTTCQSSDNPQCAAVLGADRRSAKAKTVRELASIALDIASATAKDSHSFLSGEADKVRSDALNDCVLHYGQAVGQLETAREDFDAGKFDDAEKETGDAEDAGDRCEQAFTDRHLKSTVSDVDKKMKDRASVASDLIDLLWTVKRSGARRLSRA